jgi:hypothetical protein
LRLAETSLNTRDISNRTSCASANNPTLWRAGDTESFLYLRKHHDILLNEACSYLDSLVNSYLLIPSNIISHIIMSRAEDDREGLSPSPPNLLDIFEDDDESDDVYEPVPEESEYTTSTNNESEDEAEYAGILPSETAEESN